MVSYKGYLKDNAGNICYTVEDTGWITATLTDSFEPYNSSYTCEYRKIGKIVSLRGVLKPTTEITATNNVTIITTLPQEFRPSMNTYQICQGSNNNKWLLTIAETGGVGISRYGTTSNINIPTSAWLIFTITYFVE